MIVLVRSVSKKTHLNNCWQPIIHWIKNNFMWANCDGECLFICISNVQYLPVYLFPEHSGFYWDTVLNYSGNRIQMGSLKHIGGMGNCCSVLSGTNLECHVCPCTVFERSYRDNPRLTLSIIHCTYKKNPCVYTQILAVAQDRHSVSTYCNSQRFPLCVCLNITQLDKHWL